jgi:hypothetical protein
LSLREGIFRRSYHPSEKLFSREVIIPQWRYSQKILLYLRAGKKKFQNRYSTVRRFCHPLEFISFRRFYHPWKQVFSQASLQKEQY